jgi:hypothetical protein
MECGEAHRSCEQGAISSRSGSRNGSNGGNLDTLGDHSTDEASRPNPATRTARKPHCLQGPDERFASALGRLRPPHYATCPGPLARAKRKRAFSTEYRSPASIVGNDSPLIDERSRNALVQRNRRWR